MGNKFSSYQMLYTFHCTFKCYTCVNAVSTIIYHIHTLSNVVIEPPPSFWKHPRCATIRRGGGVTTTTEYEAGPSPSTEHMSARLTKRINLKFDDKENTSLYVLHWLITPGCKTHQQVMASFINFNIWVLSSVCWLDTMHILVVALNLISLSLSILPNHMCKSNAVSSPITASNPTCKTQTR